MFVATSEAPMPFLAVLSADEHPCSSIA